jgi:tetratricopeptide (TPR) repeat protein
MARHRNVAKIRSADVNTGARSRWPSLFAGIAIITLAVLAIYWPSLQGGFILDDDLYLTQNPLIRSSDGFWRYWLTTEAVDYYPISNCTLWVEWRLWGMDPTGYRVTNLALHVLDSLLIWVILRELAIPAAFFAAMLFAIHPVNVESVAWIAQRKNELSLLFFLLSIWCYIRSQPPGVQPTGTANDRAAACDTRRRNRFVWYLVSLAAFAASGLSKGSTIVLPLILLLITWCQFDRLTRRDVVRAAPFFAIALALTVLNVWSQTRGSAESVRNISATGRLLGAGAVIWFYLWKAFIPVHLVFVYPQWDIQPGEIRWWLPLVAAMAVTGVLFWQRHKKWGRPLLLAWTFFGVALVPVMGFIDVGFMRHSLVADHYQHIALISAVALVAAAAQLAGVADARGHCEAARWVFGSSWGAQPSVRSVAVGLAVAGALGLLSWQQARLYGDPIRLYETTLVANPNCWLAENNLGAALGERGHTKEAIEHFHLALAINYNDPDSHTNLGRALAKLGEIDAAMEEYKAALKIQSDYVPALFESGMALAAAGKTEDAIQKYQEALRIQNEYPDAHLNLGLALTKIGRIDEAIRHFEAAVVVDRNFYYGYLTLANALADAGRTSEAIERYKEAVRLRPENAEARYNLAATLAASNHVSEAIAQYEDLLRLSPGHFEAENNLGSALAMGGRLTEALAHFERAVKLKPDYSDAHFNLAMAYAHLGDLRQARDRARRALELARSQDKVDLAGQIQSWLDAASSER